MKRTLLKLKAVRYEKKTNNSNGENFASRFVGLNGGLDVEYL